MVSTKKSGGYIAVSEQDKILSIKQSFKGETQDIEVTFPKGLGANHPFDFLSVEKLLIKYGVMNSIVDKMTDEIVGDFEVKLKNPNAQTLINSFTHDSNLHQNLREWVKEGLSKGNGFMEIDLSDLKVRVLNANYMYVKRNKYGKVLEYNQWNRPFKMFNRETKDVPFKPNQIAHLPINRVPGQPYGYGMIYSNERIIENLIKNEQDLQLINSRKAGAPYHIAVGAPGGNTPKPVVDAVRSNLQYLRNTVEWVTDGDTVIKSIDFPGLGKSLTEAQMYFYRQLLAGTETPEVMMGSGQLNEGIARVQLEVRKRKIESLREQIGSIIEEKILRPILLANSLDEIPTFVWQLPTEEDIDKRLAIIQTALSSAMTSPVMRAALEIEQAKLLGFEDIENLLVQPEDAEEKALKDMERQMEEDIPQPEVPGVKPKANESLVNEFIKKIGNEFCVFSHETGKNVGCYSSKEEAQKRLAQIKKFKDSDNVEINQSLVENEDMSIREWVNIVEIYRGELIK